MRNTRPGRRTTVPSVDQLESRQLLSTAAMPVHSPVLAHPHHALQVHHTAVVGRVHAGHLGAADPAVAVTASATSTTFSMVAQFNASFNATVAIADNDIWAVGDSNPNTSNQQPLAVHFNGTNWSVVPSPTIGKGGSFGGVAAVASNDVWAVGRIEFRTAVDRALERGELERRFQSEAQARRGADCGHGHLDEQRLGRGVAATTSRGTWSSTGTARAGTSPPAPRSPAPATSSEASRPMPATTCGPWGIASPWGAR